MIQHFQVIIIGGRVAGCALAIHLGRAGIETLVLERDALPSLPAVSCPIIFAPTMTMLDKLGISESEYAATTPPLREFVFEGEEIFTARHHIPSKDGRDYAYAVDRQRFDAALWSVAEETPHVTLQQKTAVVKLLFDTDRVTGVEVRDKTTGETTRIHADLVIGADGRFSFTARLVNACEDEFKTPFHTSAYYAYWKNVGRFDGDEPIIHLFRGTGRYGVLLLDGADNTTSVLVEGHPTLFARAKSATDTYHDILNRHASLRHRLQHAKQVTTVRGMRRIRHLYRQAGGPGWGLVGDAVHQKDPLDGQGIYNTLFTADALSNAIRCYFDGASWERVMQDYKERVYAETLPMLRATVGRIAREVYSAYPVWFGRTVGRWVFTNEAYLDRWIRLMIRDIPAEGWLPPSLVLDGLIRGLKSDLMSVVD